MRFLSVCSGIEAASVAWGPLGWSAVAFAEIEPAPSAVLAHHYPDVPNWGDMTKFQEWPDVAINLLCGGTPCQSFSVAGLRKGLDDPRGNLMLTFGAIAARYRPQWLVWENVPGVLSSDGGRDFASFLGLLSGQAIDIPEGDWSNSGIVEGIPEAYGLAYRVLDAQFFGVPQRRRRVFVVGHLGDWRRAAAVLLERHSLSGHPAPSRKAGKAAPTIPSRSTAGGGLGTDFDCDGGLIDVTPTLNASYGEQTGQDFMNGLAVPTMAFKSGQSEAAGGTFVTEEYAPTLQAQNNGSTAVPAVAFSIQAGALRENPDSGPDGVGVQPDHAYTLEARAEVQAVAFQERGRDGGRNLEVGGEIAYALTAPKDGGRAQERNVLTPAMQVRRLTPEECEALQGFPRHYTQVPYRGKPMADGPRYKALGNSWAVPVVRWIGQRIEQVESLTP